MKPSTIDLSPENDGTDSLIDSFTDDRAPGRTIGSTAPVGFVRNGIDREGIIGIDHGALRIQPLVNPGWGKAGVAYGPYVRRNGLAFGAFLTNGHNISRTAPLPDGLKMRLWRWALGTETEKPFRRIFRWARTYQKKLAWRRLKQWCKTGTRFFQVAPINENLAVGWFPTLAPADPLLQGNSFVVHAVVPEGGELWTRIGSEIQRSLRGLQDVPMYYLVVLRENGAAYYAASVPDVPGLTAYPVMRLLAIDPFNADKSVFAGIHQSVLGEIGFRVDTRVYRAQVAMIPEFANWYGSAHGADMLTGSGLLNSSAAEIGGAWSLWEGDFIRTSEGLAANGSPGSAILYLAAPSGVVHFLIRTTDKPTDGIGLIWRAKDKDNLWSVEMCSRQCRLSIKEAGVWSRFPATQHCRLLPNTLNSVQVVDDGLHLRIYLNGGMMFGGPLCDMRMQEGTGVGLFIREGGFDGVLRSFEAHPREIPAPPTLDLGPFRFPKGDQLVVEDDFDGPPSDLDGRVTTLGNRSWRKEIGKGAFRLTGNHSAQVAATVAAPCPGRTAYTIDWGSPNFADISVAITPPGTCKGNREKGRGGLIFWQDPQNYITWSLFHGDFPASSIAAFFCRNGFEELYDAVWTNIGSRVDWGVPFDFRVVSDGRRFLTFINDEPVLYRALSDVYPDWNYISINRVGLVANWEWGTDTGSLFQNFIAKDRA